MARTFNGSSHYLVGSAPVTSLPITISVWSNTSDTSGSKAIVAISDTEPAVANDILRVSHVLSSPRFLRTRADYVAGGGIATTSNSPSVDAWDHNISIFAAGTDGYLAQLNDNSVSSGTVTGSSAPSGLDNITIGAIKDKTSAFWFWSGHIAEVAVWNAKLSQGDIEQLNKGFSPLLVRLRDLVFYAPLIRDEDVDYISGITLTATGGLSSTDVVDHPRIFRPAPQSFHGF